MGGANSESKECMERCNRPISYKNALLHKVSGIKISFTKNFFWGGGGGGGGGTHIAWPKATARRRVVWREAETTSIHFTK